MFIGGVFTGCIFCFCGVLRMVGGRRCVAAMWCLCLVHVPDSIPRCRLFSPLASTLALGPTQPHIQREREEGFLRDEETRLLAIIHVLPVADNLRL
jgi:hypothetical protein